jgi:hypothetical protein
MFSPVGGSAGSTARSSDGTGDADGDELRGGILAVGDGDRSAGRDERNA